MSEVEPFPDASPGSIAALAVGGVDGGSDAAGNGVSEESPQSVGREAELSDFVGEPDAEGASAAWTSVAVATKDAPSTDDFTLWTGLVESVQEAVANESADDVAMRA